MRFDAAPAFSTVGEPENEKAVERLAELLEGFTWEDVDALREMAKSAEWAAEWANGGDGSAEAGVAASDLSDLADRIAALLPPRNHP